MKYLVLILMFIACGQKKSYDQDSQVPDFINESEYLILNATKTYHPSSSMTDIKHLEESREVIIPNKLNVTFGNAGNYYAFLEIDDIVCYYKGGSIFSYPLQMAVQSEIDKGNQYVFDYCSDSFGLLGTEAGSKHVIMDSISLTIHNGDSTMKTSVSVILEVI